MERALMTCSPDWLQSALADRQATDICINGSQAAFIDRGQGLISIDQKTGFTDATLWEWVHELLRISGKTWDAKYPFVDGILPTGHRYHLTLPPMSLKGILLSIRRLPTQDDAKTRFESRVVEFLAEQVVRGDSMVISGATGSGKTTLLRDLLQFVPVHERILALEDTPELAPLHPHFVSMQSRPANADGMGEISIRTLLKQALRMRPDRIILGECRGAEILDLLQAINTGHNGCMATIHANNTREALRRIELLALLGHSSGLDLNIIREWITGGIRWLIQLKRVGANRVIDEISKVEGREGNTILLRPVLQSGQWLA